MYNMQQVTELSRLCEIKVIAPVPWAPKFDFVPKYVQANNVKLREVINGIEVFHPRYFITPKVGRSFYAYFFFRSLVNKIRETYRLFPFDIIYAPWAYPDGVGCFHIAKTMGIPLVIGVLGSDINTYSNYFFRKKMLADALNNCNRVIAVSNALKERVVSIGVKTGNIAVILNGVDINLFRPVDTNEIRMKYGLKLDKKYILYVGNLYLVKGVDYLIKSFKLLSSIQKNVDLIIIGDGRQKSNLLKQVHDDQLEGRVKFLGTKRHEEISSWINCCDLFVLPSISEGCPNVLLEAMACGKPIVASNIGGIPEIIDSSKYGILVPPKDYKQLFEALQSALNKTWDSILIRNRVVGFTWEMNAKKLNLELQKVLGHNTEV